MGKKTTGWGLRYSTNDISYLSHYKSGRGLELAQCWAGWCLVLTRTAVLHMIVSAEDDGKFQNRLAKIKCLLYLKSIGLAN